MNPFRIPETEEQDNCNIVSHGENAQFTKNTRDQCIRRTLIESDSSNCDEPKTPAVTPPRSRGGKSNGSRGRRGTSPRGTGDNVNRKRGKGYSKDEVLILAKTWIEQSLKGPSQRESSFWKGVMSICSRSSLNRTEDSLRNNWRRLARDTQIYLARRETVLEKCPSGAKEDDVEDLINELYRKKAGKKDKDGVLMYAPPFKYVEAALELSKSPKFESKCTSGRKSRSSGAMQPQGLPSNPDTGGEMSDAVQSCPLSNPKVGHSYPLEEQLTGDTSLKDSYSGHKKRPKGIRKMKEEQRMETDVRRMEIAIDKLSKRMDEGTTVLKRIQSHAEQQSKADNAFKLLQVLPSGSDAYQKILEDLLRAQQEAAGRNEQNHDGDVESEPKRRRIDSVPEYDASDEDISR